MEKLKGKKAELKKALETHHDKEHKLKLDEINQKNSLKEHEANESEKRSAIRSYTARVSTKKGRKKSMSHFQFWYFYILYSLNF